MKGECHARKCRTEWSASGPVAPTNGQLWAVAPALLFTQERSRKLVAALEEPFDVSEIKWRVTNTSQIASRNGPRFRGQMLAYADPRAYTDRLNDLFTPSGWTRDYSVQLVQNFERKERGSAERTITAKIVVTCKVTSCRDAVEYNLGMRCDFATSHVERQNLINHNWTIRELVEALP